MCYLFLCFDWKCFECIDFEKFEGCIECGDCSWVFCSYFKGVKFNCKYIVKVWDVE